MKKVLLSLAFLSFSGVAAADADWKTAKVTEVKVLESFPVQYSLTFEKRCNDTAVEGIKFVKEDEVVVGVAVKNDPTVACLMHEPVVTLQTVRILGGVDDPQIVQILK